jgi:hypothetical protein
MIDNYRQYGQESTYISLAVQDGQPGTSWRAEISWVIKAGFIIFPKYALNPKLADAAFGFDNKS